MYAGVPPETDNDIEPSFNPLHETLLSVAVAEISRGCVMLYCAPTEQPLASVTITLYNPAALLLIS